LNSILVLDLYVVLKAMTGSSCNWKRSGMWCGGHLQFSCTALATLTYHTEWVASCGAPM